MQLLAAAGTAHHRHLCARQSQFGRAVSLADSMMLGDLWGSLRVLNFESSAHRPGNRRRMLCCTAGPVTVAGEPRRSCEPRHCCLDAGGTSLPRSAARMRLAVSGTIAGLSPRQALLWPRCGPPVSIQEDLQSAHRSRVHHACAWSGMQLTSVSDETSIHSSRSTDDRSGIMCSEARTGHQAIGMRPDCACTTESRREVRVPIQ